MILITASRRPSPRTRSFIKDLVSILPGSKRVNRGHKSLTELAIEAISNNLKYVMVVTERRGNPGSLMIYEVSGTAPYRVSLKRISRIILSGVKLSRENPESSKSYGAKTIGVDYSNCISSDCFLISDLLIKLAGNGLSEKPDIMFVLSEERFIELRALNVHGKVIGPVIRVKKVLPG